MKYRIRNTETGVILSNPNFHMCQNGIIRSQGRRGGYTHLKAEMEVAEGFHVGDYVLCFDEQMAPCIYLIINFHVLKSVDLDYSSKSLYPCDLIRYFEVIKCR